MPWSRIKNLGKPALLKNRNQNRRLCENTVATLFTLQAPTQPFQLAWHRLHRLDLLRNLTVLPDIVKSVGVTPFFYRELNSGKFKIIHEMEQELPLVSST